MKTFLGITQKIFKLAIPMAGSQLITIISSFICMTMLAGLGYTVLAASALIFAVELSIMVTTLSVLFSLSILIGHAFGAKKYILIGNYLQQGWVAGLVMCPPVMLFFWHVHSILLFFGQSPEVAAIAQIYFHAYVWCVIPAFLSAANQQFLFAAHKKVLLLLSSLLSALALLISAYTLIYGKFGLPELGVAGLGYAKIVQQLFFFLFTVAVFYFRKSFQPFQFFKFRVHQNLEHAVQMLRVGWPISVQVGCEMMSIFANSLMVGWLGTTALAASQVVNQYLLLVIVPIFSLAQASGILVGNACGAQEFHEIKKLGFSTMVLVLTATCMVGLVFILAPNKLASIYLDINNPANKETLELIHAIFWVAALTLMFDGVRNVLTGMLRGLLDTRFPMYVVLITIWLIGMPASYLLAFVFHLGVVGIALGGLVGVMAGAILILLRWKSVSSKVVGV